MYTYIDTKHAIKVISWWLNKLNAQLPNNFPLEAVKAAMKLIMKNNVFEFGVFHFLQLINAALETSIAVI